MKKVLASQEELGIYLSCLEETLAYNLPLLLPLGDTSFDDVSAALGKLLGLHEQWNTRFALNEEGELVKWIVSDKLVISESKVSSLNKKALVRPFELLDSPLYRFEFYKTPNGSFLFADFHHIIMDGFSLDRFFNDLYALLEGKEVSDEK